MAKISCLVENDGTLPLSKLISKIFGDESNGDNEEMQWIIMIVLLSKLQQF
jgi:hypothetical protein